MKKRFARILALLLVAVLALPYGVFAAEGERAGDTVHVVSEPAGADVYVDGALYAPAVTPCDVLLPAGTHTICVRMSGFDDYETTAKAGESVSAHLSATTPKPGDPGVRTLVVAWDDWGPADANYMTWDYYDMFINRKTPRSDDWEDPDLINAYDYFTHFGEAAIGVTLREALCIVMNDTGWYDEENHIRWHYLIEFYEGKDEYLQASNITCYGRGTAYWMEGNLFTRYTENGPVEDTDAVEHWSHDGCFTINGDRDRDGTPDVTLYGWSGSAFSWDGKWNLMLMSSDAHVTGLKIEPTMHVAVSMPFWQRRYYFNFGNVSITNCVFESFNNGVGRFFLGYPGQYGTGADGYGMPGAFDLDGFTISGCTFHDEQLGIIVATGDVDYSSCKNLILQGNHITNGMIFVRNVDAHTWYMWGSSNAEMATGDPEWANRIGVCEHNTLENVTVSGNLVEFTEDAIYQDKYDGSYGNVIHLGNSNLGGSHNTMRNVTVRCNCSALGQANVDAYGVYPNAGVRIENAAVGDGLNDGYDGELASSMCEVTDNLFENLTIEYNAFRINYFDVKNISLMGTAQTGTNNVFRNIRIAGNQIDTVRGMRFFGADGTSCLGCVAEGALENVTVCDNEIRCLRKTGWSADSDINTSGEQDDFGIHIVGAAPANYDGSNWDESGEEQVWDGLTSAVSDFHIERNRITGFADGVLVAGAHCERTHYITGITVSDVMITDNEIATDGINKRCRNHGILLVGAIDGGTACVLHNIDVSGNRITATNGLLAIGFYFMGNCCRFGVGDNQVLHVTVKDNQFTFADPCGYGGFPIVTADAVSGWGEIPYALGKTAVVLTESGNTASGYAWKSMKLAELSLRATDDEAAFTEKVQNACDAAIGYRYIDWSKDSFAAACDTPLFVGVCDKAEYRPGHCHRYYLSPCDEGATFAYANEVAPTCTAPGSYQQTTCCALCNAELACEDREGEPALGHDWDEGKVTVEPTETEKGERTYTCTRCGATRTEEIPEKLHEHSYTAVVTLPTCTEQGYTTHTCACGDSYVDSYVPALGHDLVTDAAVPATCTTSGLTAGEHCARCDYKVAQEVVAALGHNIVKDEAVAPTCTASGLTAGEHCTRCDYRVAQETVPALGHTWNDGEITKQATETEDGVKTYTCTRCGATKTEVIPATGEGACKHEHSHNEHKVPTCTEAGYDKTVCDDCGKVIAEEIIAALGHNWDEGKVTTAPTATKDGVKTYTCTRCGTTKTETIPATGEDKPCEGGDTCPSKNFKDVNAGDWYHLAVDFAVENGLFNGMTDTTFEPNTPMTRAMLVTVLWRYEGSPKEGKSDFTDLTADWYKDAVAWAASKGIVTGVGGGRFDPDGKITREQLAAILYRYSDYKHFDTSAKSDFAGFPDKGKISAWAKDAYSWAVGAGLITGNVGKLDPQGSATRAQVATILMRFIKNIAK